MTIALDLRCRYRKPGTSMTGVVDELSPTGAVARVQLDDVAPSFVLAVHLSALDTPAPPQLSEDPAR